MPGIRHVGAFILCAAGVLSAQAPLAFDVASVKRNTNVGQTAAAQVQKGGRFVATAVPLRLLIRNAYRVQDFQIVGGPAWLNVDRFDIEARSDRNVSADEFGAMFRRLLEDRFRLVTHSETRELPVYDLVIVRGDGALGPEFRPTACYRDQPLPPTPTGQSCGTFQFGLGRLSVRGVPMPQILQALSDLSLRTVVDRTGLTGAFDLDLKWTPEALAQRTAATRADQPVQLNGADVDLSGPSLFTAVQEQLGLKLESARGPVTVLVIDRAEHPSDN